MVQEEVVKSELQKRLHRGGDCERLRGGHKVDGRQQEGREEELAACRLIRCMCVNKMLAWINEKSGRHFS